jgi:hypothetical protein
LSETIEIYNPIAPISEGTGAARRKLESLRGKVIGFIDNAKPNFNFLVDDLAQLLVERHGVARVVRHRKSGQVPVAHDALEALAAECDAVIAGSGD